MEQPVPYLEKELNLFFQAVVDKPDVESGDIQRLLYAYRLAYEADVVFVLTNDGVNRQFVFSNTSVSNPKYELKDTVVQVTPEEYRDFLGMYDEDGLCDYFVRFEKQEYIRSILHYSAVFAGEISGCIGIIDCQRERKWAPDERRYLVKLGRALGTYITRDRLSKMKQAYFDVAEQAKSASESKTRFLFNMSHDIRTPMNAVIGYARMAQKYVLDSEKTANYLEKIISAGDELLALINQVLEMSRIESGKLTIREKPANIVKEAGAMMDVLMPTAESMGISLSLKLEGLKHENVVTDPECVSQIVLNILSNAIKYSKPGGNVLLSITEEPSPLPETRNYRIAIEDHGIGMSREFISHIFDEFSREKTSTINKIQGTGLGMSIVKRLVDLLGGTISITSELDRGTTVTTVLPMKITGEVSSEDEKSQTAELIKLKGKRVLLVEDNEMNLEIAEEILKSRGLLVESADDGDVAVAMIQDKTDRGLYQYYDFVLMDIQMPRMNGYEATRAIRSIPDPTNGHLPIIAMTANAFEEDRKEALDAGMDEHVAKPIDIRVLTRTLAKFVK